MSNSDLRSVALHEEDKKAQEKIDRGKVALTSDKNKLGIYGTTDLNSMLAIDDHKNVDKHQDADAGPRATTEKRNENRNKHASHSNTNTNANTSMVSLSKATKAIKTIKTVKISNQNLSKMNNSNTNNNNNNNNNNSSKVKHTNMIKMNKIKLNKRNEARKLNVSKEKGQGHGNKVNKISRAKFENFVVTGGGRKNSKRKKREGKNEPENHSNGND